MSIPQRPFFSAQDIITPNIDDFYDKAIKDIEAFRSHFNGITSNLTQSISQKKLDSVFSGNEMNSLLPQESRCNAFYRMIGFPVASPDGVSFYSPGFDPDLNRDPERIQKNLTIANAVLTKLQLIFNDRETYSRNSNNLFQNKDDNASALALTSVYVRPFEKQLKPGLDPFDIDTQVFEVPDRNRVNTDDFNGTTKAATNSKHILKPFIGDPRIELTVTPALNRICAPFLVDKSKSQISGGNYLKRPYIERVISVRFKNINVINSDNGQDNKFVTDLIAFIKTNSEITKPNLVELTQDKLQSLHKSEIVVFGKFVKILNALISKLVSDIVEIGKIKTNMNWKPQPDKRGPEFGCALNEVNRDDANNKTIENNIINQELQKTLSETDYDIGLDAPDLGSFSFSNIDDIIFGSIKNIPQSFDKQLLTLNRRRNETGNRANDLLREIEIITGEFSGLGLLDIIAIQAALWVIDPGALMGMLDDAAVARMQGDSQLRTDLTLPDSRFSIHDALQEFEKKLSEIYVLIGAFYQDAIKFDGKNAK